VVLFECFFEGGLRLPLSSFVSDVLKKFNVYLHQVTPNAFVRLSVYAWAVGSQGVKVDAESFCDHGTIYDHGIVVGVISKFEVILCEDYWYVRPNCSDMWALYSNVTDLPCGVLFVFLCYWSES